MSATNQNRDLYRVQSFYWNTFVCNHLTFHPLPYFLGGSLSCNYIWCQTKKLCYKVFISCQHIMKQVQSFVGHHFRQNTLWKKKIYLAHFNNNKGCVDIFFQKQCLWQHTWTRKKIFVLKNKCVQINAELGNALLYFSPNLLYEVLVGCWWCIYILLWSVPVIFIQVRPSVFNQLFVFVFWVDFLLFTTN